MKSEKPEVSRKHLATAFFKGDKQIPLRDNILVNLSYCNALMGKKGGEKREKKKKVAEVWLWDLESKCGHQGWRGHLGKGVSVYLSTEMGREWEIQVV